ncbi:MAG TPA: hypothetical protein VK658_20955 [Chryseolinea sp.]|nr:hypothetical protein [Chryseolinea sp.]
MKYRKNILLGTCLLLAISCSDTEVVPPSTSQDDPEQESLTAGLPMGPKASTDGRVAVMPALNTISTPALASAININLIGIKNYKRNPSAYTRYQSGVPYVNLGHVIGNPVFAYPSQWNVIMTPTIPYNFPYDAVKASYSSQLNQLNVSAQFKSRLLNFYDVVRNIDSRTYRDFMNSISGQLFAIAHQQRGQPGGILSPIEQFALTQVFYHLKYLTESAYNSTSTPCLPQTREQWKEIAKSAFVSGLGMGAGLAWKWGVLGLAAAAPNPLVGFVVAGGIGFVTGFIGGALMGGGIALLADCMVNKLFNPLQAYTCGTNNQFGDFRVSAQPPIGCLSNYNTNLPMFTQIPIVPNLGSTVVNPNVMADINWMLSYF